MSLVYKYIDEINKLECQTLLVEVLDVCNASIELLTPKPFQRKTLDKYRDEVTYRTILSPSANTNHDDPYTFISSAHQFVTGVLRKPNTGFYRRNKTDKFEKIAIEDYGYQNSSELFLRRGRDNNDRSIFTEANVLYHIKRLLDPSEIIDRQIIDTPQVRWLNSLMNYICQEERSIVFPKLTEKAYADHMQNLWSPDTDEENDYDPCEYPDSVLFAQGKPSANLKKAYMRFFEKKGSPKTKG